MADGAGKGADVAAHIARQTVDVEAGFHQPRQQRAGEDRVGVGVVVGQPVEGGLPGAGGKEDEGAFGRVHPGQTPATAQRARALGRKRIVATGVEDQQADPRAAPLHAGKDAVDADGQEILVAGARGGDVGG